MSTKKPLTKLTVLMSVYNGLPYLSESIESILSQSFSDFEFIIIDDCSNDGTEELLRFYAAKDPRILLVENITNIGLTKSLNKGLQLARGQYIARQDADDTSLPNRFSRQIEHLERHPDCVMVSCLFEDISSEGEFIRVLPKDNDTAVISWQLLFYNYVSGHSQVMFRKNVVIKEGGYAENRRYGQDYELWSRLIDLGEITILPQILHRRRVHDNRISLVKGKEQKSLSLNQSQNNIYKFTKKNLTIDEVQILRRFWSGHLPWESFPTANQTLSINNRLLEIFEAYFLREKNEVAYEKLIGIYKIKREIAFQFLRWAKFLISEKYFIAAMKPLYFALKWI